MTETELHLVAVHKGPTAKLDDICERYLELSPSVAYAYAAKNKLPFPTFRLNGSQKAPLMVSVRDLAAHIDKARDAARREWEKCQV